MTETEFNVTAPGLVVFLQRINPNDHGCVGIETPDGRKFIMESSAALVIGADLIAAAQKAARWNGSLGQSFGNRIGMTAIINAVFRAIDTVKGWRIET